MSTEDIIKNLKNLEHICDFSNLDKDHALFSNRNEKFLGKIKLETARNIWIVEFVCLRGKMYSFKSGDVCKNQFKGVSKCQWKHIMFEEYINCSDGNEYQKE